MHLIKKIIKIFDKSFGNIRFFTYLYYVIKDDIYGKFNWSNGSCGSFQRW